MYPGYKRRDVLDEYMVVYVALLNEGYRQENEGYLMDATIARLPWLDGESAKKFMQQLQWAAKRPDDILDSNDGASTIEEIRKFLG